jgi:hypothetical protein
MKHVLKSFTLLVAGALMITSCNKNTQDLQNVQQQISQETLAKIHNQGFGTSNVQVVEDGYLVEGDIVLTEDFLNSKPGGNILRAGNAEQYHTTNLVTVSGAKRTIKVALDSKLTPLTGYVAALDEMVNRYNSENLQITFQRVSSGTADVTFSEGHGSYLASSGFPDSRGNPYGSVKVNSNAIGTGSTSTFTNYLATIFAHELGHCIGFRHTDYMNRSYSCGGSPTNEGASNVGAIWIPNTPTGPDAKSWMLACIGSGVNRPFNANDKTALAALY